MKPAGRERDKQIAKLKGICYHEWKAVDDYYPNGVRSGFHWKCKYCRKEKYKKSIEIQKSWSTSWNDAKELWDELPKKEKVNLLIRMAIRLANDNKFDFPDSASEAWIKRK
ncbi:hypothetical protein LCGC14_1081280 [marine sediment metagenome]|uniref:Uncharacterized protein n=1 Tax=marine sediment metagenome TaxID=412755 RepID=A0A0F9MF89_9ZZZZ